jgi:putative ABC transport system ATP-binding protein
MPLKNAKPVIELIDVCKIYPSGPKDLFYALKNVNLTLKEGEFVSIIGKSGSGKSSMMNILGCLDPVKVGTYLFSGENVSTFQDFELSELRSQQIGFIFQSYNLLDKYSLLENVALPLSYNNVGRKERFKIAAEYLKVVGLEDRMNHKPGDVSGGQRQRAAIARALVNKPRIILADEPTGNLDSNTEQEILSLLKDLHLKYNTTIIIVTHDEAVALYADRIVTLFDGLVYADVDFTKVEAELEAGNTKADIKSDLENKDELKE